MDTYEAIMEKEGRYTYIRLPFNAKEVYQKPKGVIYVKGTIDGVCYRGKLIKRGENSQAIIVNKKLQKAIGFVPGEVRTITLTIEEEPEEERKKKVTAPITSKMELIGGFVSRSITHQFSGKTVSEELINQLLEVACQAPSAQDKRPWHFVIVQNKKVLSSMAKGNKSIKMIAQASCCIVVCGDQVEQPVLEFLIEDCSAATQNILLAAHGVNLGTVSCGVVLRSKWCNDLIKMLDLPYKVVPVRVIALGYPKEVKRVRKHFEKSKVHMDRW